ncbi:hypothetical protein [Desulfosporosinus meridiei]|uniref:Uncharacterized protein n=1 Tax=Desulfosporosinus meridiei (strain ATCC BAA-275 / DSM 13257 / KCTC 12902 / NCIMB 13706 / S10) TaxID=768704 RepID=J7J2J3_DESMD|nr:hypothetical protein [Desulfosporosinus meridiei]AFQ45196.1 hypothetical protein Desmer_3323 [Desulfosporosinus meridiei DSM 13257]
MKEIIKVKDLDFVPPVNDVRGVGTTIIGYLMMFILLQSVMFMFTLAEVQTGTITKGGYDIMKKIDLKLI